MHASLLKLLNATATRLKGEPYRVDPDLPLSALLGYAMARAAGMARCLLRGVVLSWDPRRLVCLGPGVVLSNRRGIRFGRGVTLGRGVMIDGLAREGVVLGDGCSIGPYGMVRATGVLSQLGRGFRMGHHSSMDAYAFVGASGGVTVGNNVIMGQKVSFHAEEHLFDDLSVPIRHQGVRQRGIVIEDDCWIGSNVTFLDGAHVEPGCVVGAGSIVKGRIPANSVVAGNPARVIRPRGQRRGAALADLPVATNRRPRIGVDLHVVDGIYQGSRTHVLELYAALLPLLPQYDFHLMCAQPQRLLAFSPAFHAPHVHLVTMPSANPVQRLCRQLPGLQRQLGLDLLHTQYILPLPNRCRGVVTIHDVLFETHPQYFGRVFRLRSKLLMRWSAWRAAHVFTVSEYSRRTMLQLYPVSEDRVSVTHNGADLSRFHPGDEGLATVQAHGLTSGGYLLSVGRLEPRKNHATLLRAYAALGPSAPPLVIVGQRHFGFDEVFTELDRLNLRPRVHLLDRVGDDELPTLYRHALLFAYPTWAEGFGMPLLEAMASGIPVVSSNSTSIPEVVGDAGLLVDPADTAALSAALRRLLDDPALRAELARRGLQQARRFQWQQAAEEAARVFQRLLGPWATGQGGQS